VFAHIKLLSKSMNLLRLLGLYVSSSSQAPNPKLKCWQMTYISAALLIRQRRLRLEARQYLGMIGAEFSMKEIKKCLTSSGS
jgi:hypothetical protein